MTTRRDFLKKSVLGAAGVALAPHLLSAQGLGRYQSNRPAWKARKFFSEAVEAQIDKIKAKIGDDKLAWMFENCYPNTLDTTVIFGSRAGKPDTFVITGDIPAMWLRDSAAQVFPYLPLASQDAKLKQMLKGVIHRQMYCIQIDCYANAFNKTALPKEENHWASDETGSQMKAEVHERKWEIDSLCYPVRLAYNYWKLTGDTSVFDEDWQKATQLIVRTFKEQQRKEGKGDYFFLRTTDRQLDTVSNVGYGRPLNPVGLINSSFRPSDDNTTYGFLIPSNLFAVKSLRQIAELERIVVGRKEFAVDCEILADEVAKAIEKYGIVTHPQYGKVYAYEVDGFGNHTFMDDANVPSLLALPYLESVPSDSVIYQNTRRLVWSEDNPYFIKGKVAEGIGGPHIGTYDCIWPMSIIMRAMTSTDDTEIRWCLKTLRNTDANTGFMHETFHKDKPEQFTRKWFAWANTLFGELLVKLVTEGKEALVKDI